MRTSVGVSSILALVLVLTMALPVTALDSDDDGLADDFETRWGLTSPDLADSDGNGLIDAAEDHDGDRLGALGEQRYGTDPGVVDTDGDGVSDGDEDSDGDGIIDSRQQDQRPAPAGLHPEPKAAWWDRPANYDDVCHGDQFDPDLHPCVYGDQESDTNIVLFGDSHALQWLPALTAAADEAGWRVTTLTKAACPPARVLSGRKDPVAGTSCERWREKALRWLAQEEPDLAILAGGGRIYKLVDKQGERIPEEERTQRWQAGLELTLAELPEATRAVVLADTPFLRTNPATCLEKSPADLSACVTPRSAAIDPAFDLAEGKTARAAGAAYADLTRVVCPYSPCPVVIGDVMVWRNRDHITATFAELLAPSMRDAISEALAGE
ncbi:MAG: hypothetical protein DRQ55_18320 [Planctomycetota bacterium]|nr:MAG: hypothetical protein DRQ55_18320 [Planctomycetota bacterium]